MSNQLDMVQPRNTQPGIYTGEVAFEAAQRMAKAISSSNIVPETYRGNVANTMIAMEFANRSGVSVLAIMQNLHIIHGRPSLSSAFIISVINECGVFSRLRFKMGKNGKVKTNGREIDNITCRAYATELATGEVIEGPEVSYLMAINEQWDTKKGSKWQTMPELMIQYRAAAFFGRLYCPEILLGMHSMDEGEDIQAQVKPAKPDVIESLNQAVKAKAQPATEQAEPEYAPFEDVQPTPNPTPDQDLQSVPRTGTNLLTAEEEELF